MGENLSGRLTIGNPCRSAKAGKHRMLPAVEWPFAGKNRRLNGSDPRDERIGYQRPGTIIIGGYRLEVGASGFPAIS
jgi:hypothetical protein